MSAFSHWHYCSVCVFLLTSASCCWAAPLIINEDDSHFFMFRTPEEMTLEGLHAFVDQYAGTKTTHLFLCPNAMKASYRSEAWDAIWDMAPNQRVKEDEAAPVARRWMDNARLLWERGLDPYAVWIARCREKNISPWLSMRMNDVHNVDDVDSYIHSRFWMEHPEYWRVPGGAGWTDRALDYGIPEVREHHMKLVRELLERYDPDGLELDWMRFGYHFAPGKEAEGCALLTQFMRDARALTRQWAEKRGHPVLLGARVPTLPESARKLGMDAEAWVREGLVDMLVPTPFWATAEFDIPMEDWRRVLVEAREAAPETASTPVLAAGIEILLRAYPGAGHALNDLASVRGFAASALHRGADAVYTFNYMDPAPMDGGEAAYRQLLEESLALDEVMTRSRRYPITYRDTVGPGMSNDARLPANPAEQPTFTFAIGPAPSQGRVLLIVGLAQRDQVDRAVLSATFNGAPCLAVSDRDQPDRYPGAVRALCFECPLTAAKAGHNTVVVAAASDQTDLPEQQVVWAELLIEPRPVRLALRNRT